MGTGGKWKIRGEAVRFPFRGTGCLSCQWRGGGACHFSDFVRQAEKTNDTNKLSLAKQRELAKM